jgi:lipopolysaccharide transport system permease protein
MTNSPHMLTHTKNFFQAKGLLIAWTGRNIRGRYQQSFLGWLWALAQPAAQVAIFTVVFTQFVPVDTGSIAYPVFSFVAVVPWTLLAAALPDMSNSLIENMSLVTKIYFPREVLPVAAMLARLLDFCVATGLLVVLMVIYQVPVFPLGLLIFPFILATQLLLILGIGLAAAALNVFFRDVRSLMVLGLQLWFYASPIIYPVSMVPERLHFFYYLNPMAGIISAYRDVLLERRVPGNYMISAFVVSLLIFLAGYWLFKQLEHRFADIV